MLKNTELRPVLLSFINNREYQNAIDLLIKEEVTTGTKIFNWFCESYKNSKQHSRWIEFFTKILSIEWSDDKKSQFKYFIQEIHEYAKNEAHELIIPLINDQKQQHIILSSLTAHHADTNSSIKLLTEVESRSEQLKLYKLFIQYGIEKYNGVLLQKLKELKSFDFNECAKELNLTEKNIKKLEKLLSLSNEKAVFINEKMRAFVNGYGNIKGDDILLTFAQVRSRKIYDYDPVFIDLDNNEFENFLNILSSAEKPIRKHFICANYHFLSGIVEISNDGKAKIWFVDALGTERKNEKETVEDIEVKEPIKIFAKVFPKHEIYISREVRQRTPKTCGVFALDDTAHSFTVPLSDQKTTIIWDYLSAASKKDTAKKIYLENGENSSVTVMSCETPLGLTRTMQTRSLKSKLIPNRSETEQQLIINKKGETTMGSTLKFFPSTSAGEEKNTRMDYKFNNMAEKNWEFLLNNSPDKIQQSMQFFTVNEFKNRMDSNNTVKNFSQLQFS
jgi:hypothetical protein